ncbi:gastrula zinc finger protein XlCGF8.2DB-like [Frieseomelitta varia]|uniref:gastrula zinc finger protein XlCGF8.2DB-like n=1 Tax=Frieseomelitta varia TaxID=561572 RepID=UPI001CB69EF9|nr:gastrula zinc finger protein XlCGF8.2DB-like [Frieseomelitta varia]
MDRDLDYYPGLSVKRFNFCIHARLIVYVSGAATTRETVYPCRVCGKIYSIKSSMYTHLRLCGKEPKFNCVLCGKRFKYKHRLQSHLTSNLRKRGFAFDVANVINGVLP